MKLNLLNGYAEAIEEIKLYSGISEEILNKVVEYINITMEFYKEKLTDGEWIYILYEAAEQVAQPQYKKEGTKLVEIRVTSPKDAVKSSLEKAIRNNLNLNIQPKK